MIQLLEGLDSVNPFIDSHPQLLSLLDQFHSIFYTPIGLPHIRNQDHNIDLQRGSKPICVRPYQYPYFQNIEIEKLLQEMLNLCIICPSQSPFSFLVLLVHK